MMLGRLSLLSVLVWMINTKSLAQTWIEHISEGGFRVEFPEAPVLKSSTVGNNVRTYDAKVEGENRAFAVSAVYLISLSEDLRLHLEARAEANVEAISKSYFEDRGRKLLESRRMTVSGAPAYYMVYETKDGYVGTYLYVEKDGNLYRVISLGRPGIEDSETVNRFFSSFALIEKRRNTTRP